MLLGLALFQAGCASKPAAKPVAGAKPAVTTAKSASKAEVSGEDSLAKAYAHYATAIILELNLQPDKALEEYEKCVRADPSAEGLVLELVRRMLLRKQNDRAIALLDLAAAQPESSGQILTWKGLALAQAGKTAQAIAAHRAALKKDPKLLLSYHNLAQLYYQNGQKKEVLKVLLEAGKQKSEDPAFLVGSAELMTAFRPLLGPPGEALTPQIKASLAAANAKKPGDPLLLEKMAECYKAVGDAKQATALYQEIISKHPNLTEPRKRLAEVYLYSNDTTNAIHQLEQVIRDNPVEVQAYYLLGNLYLESRDYDKALEYFSKVRLLNENFEPVQYDIARAYLAMDKPQEALAALDRVKNRAKNFEWEYFAGIAYVGAKNYNAALEHFNNAEVIASATASNQLTHLFYFQVGAAHERAQHYDQAEQYFEKCLKLEPNDVEAMNYMGYMWAERGVKLDQAKSLIEKALQLAPDNAAFLDSMGWVLHQLNQPKEALPYLLKAVQKSPKPDATVYEHLGDTYQQLHQMDKARESWRKSIDLEANDAVKKKLEAP